MIRAMPAQTTIANKQRTNDNGYFGHVAAKPANAPAAAQAIAVMIPWGTNCSFFRARSLARSVGCVLGNGGAKKNARCKASPTATQ